MKVYTINLLRAKSKDFYQLLLLKTHTNPINEETDLLVLIKLPGRISFPQFVGFAKKILNYASFISNLLTELL